MDALREGLSEPSLGLADADVLEETDGDTLSDSDGLTESETDADVDGETLWLEDSEIDWLAEALIDGDNDGDALPAGAVVHPSWMLARSDASVPNCAVIYASSHAKRCAITSNEFCPICMNTPTSSAVR